MVADTILINLAVITSLVARLLWILAYQNPQPAINYQQTLNYYLRVYYNSAIPLTVICLTVFSFWGFYTYGRFYRGKYKTLIILQAVSLGYLIFGLLAYISQGPILGFMKDFLNLPRGVLILSWVLTMALMVAARAWSRVWRQITHVEKERANGRGPEKIRQVLVIGGAGFIGSALLPMLLEKGYHVRLLDLLLFGIEPIEPWLDHPYLEVVKADFRQVDQVVSAMQGVDAVVHLGGIVGDPACDLNEELTIEINLMATRMIAEVAKGSGVKKFIFASTTSVYGASNEMVDERSELKPVSLYASSKMASEKVLLKMADDRFAPTIVRFGTVYGLSGRLRFDLVVNLLTAKAVVDREITIFGGNQWRPFVHVEDAARSILVVLEAKNEIVQNQIYNVGASEQNFTVRQVGEMIQRYVPNTRMVINKDHVDPSNYRVSSNKIQKQLGFVPQWTLDRGIQQVIEVLRAGRVTNYKDPLYSNVKYLSGERILTLTRHEEGWAYELLDEIEQHEIPTTPLPKREGSASGEPHTEAPATRQV